MFSQPTEFIESASFDVIQVILNLVAATLFGLLAAVVYRRTHHGLSYSQGFVVSMVLVSVIACGAIMIIGSSIARAFGLVGALSIIRYRTVVKDTRDASFVFLSLVGGFAAGTGNFLIGALTIVTALGIALVTHRFRFGVLKEHDFILTLAIPRRLGAAATGSGAHASVIQRLCERQSLLHVETDDGSDSLLLTYDVSLKEGIESTSLIEELAALPDVRAPKLIFARGDPNF